MPRLEDILTSPSDLETNIILPPEGGFYRTPHNIQKVKLIENTDFDTKSVKNINVYNLSFSDEGEDIYYFPWNFETGFQTELENDSPISYFFTTALTGSTFGFDHNSKSVRVTQFGQETDKKPDNPGKAITPEDYRKHGYHDVQIDTWYYYQVGLVYGFKTGSKWDFHLQTITQKTNMVDDQRYIEINPINGK